MMAALARSIPDVPEEIGGMDNFHAVLFMIETTRLKTARQPVMFLQAPTRNLTCSVRRDPKSFLPITPSAICAKCP